jgi:hypothetical protein
MIFGHAPNWSMTQDIADKNKQINGLAVGGGGYQQYFYFIPFLVFISR